MAKKITGSVKLQIPAGKATPAPPVGTALVHEEIPAGREPANRAHAPVCAAWSSLRHH